MLASLKHLFSNDKADVRGRALGMYAFLVAANVSAWVWALLTFRHHPIFLGTALLAYGFGLRHAVDADHIAAIDNVTRKLMQENRRPIAVGFFFSIGHSLVLIIGVAAIVLTDSALKGGFNAFNDYSGIVGTTVSTIFLLAIASMNLMIALSIFRTFRNVRNGGAYVEEELDTLLNKRGVLARLFRPVFRIVKKSWHMVPVGFLFGLGFDTMTEVSLLSIAATEAAKGMSLWSIMVFPILFTAGMSLVDSTDGMAMLGAYGWAYVKPVRKLYYNLTITLVSVVVALVIGGVEGLGLIAGKLNLAGWFWCRVDLLNDHFGYLGYAIIVIFLLSWLLSYAVYRLKRYDQLEVAREF
jgi:high-affinity nickel-transport protein